jgi:L-fuconolactonase
MRIDAHQHFWHYNPQQHVWMTDQMDVLKRDYLPDDLAPLVASIDFHGTVAVQARQLIEETQWLLDLADRNDFMLGVVGWIDLRSPDLQEQLRNLGPHPKFVGVRHVIHDEPDDEFMLRPDFRRGIASLREFDLTYDLLLFPRHLPLAVKLVEEFPEQPFVLDHIGNPDIRARQMSPWKEGIEALARDENVYCKLSGMATKAPWNNWSNDDFHCYLDAVIEAFGTNRVMIGSDWPVCTLSGQYTEVMRIVIDYVEQFPADVRAGILGENCARFYGLNHSAKD